jgi:Fe-S cluster assembly ATPase SufC
MLCEIKATENQEENMATLTELQQDLNSLKTARNNILTGAQEYSGMNGKISVKRADLTTINAEIERIEMRIAIASQRGRLSHSQAVFAGER